MEDIIIMRQLAPHRYPPQSTIIFVSFVYKRRHLRLGAALIAGPSAPNAARPGAVPHPCSHLSSTHLAGAPRAHESMRTLSLRAGADSGACMCWQARTRADGRPHERTSAHATTASVNPCSRQKVNHSFIHSSTGPPINLHALANTLAHSEGRCGPRPWGCCAHGNSFDGEHVNGEKGALWKVRFGKQRTDPSAIWPRLAP